MPIEETSDTITVQTPDGSMPGHLWRPPSGTGPGILLLQEIFGVSDYIISRAQDLADLGYVVLAPEIYWRIGASRVENGPDALGQAFALAQQVDWDAAVTDGAVALEELGRLPGVDGGTGLVGFCFGGALAFNVAAVTDPDVLVSYYGSSLPSMLDLAPEVTAPSLHHFGLADSYIEAETVELVRKALTGSPDVTFETYEGADHAFDNPDFPMHHPEASALAWERTVAFLDTHLPPG
jgi:carboxymethylenebutenolidase